MTAYRAPVAYRSPITYRGGVDIPDWPASGPRIVPGLLVGLHVGSLWLHAHGYGHLRPAGSVPMESMASVTELRGSPVGETATASLQLSRGARILSTSPMCGLSCRLLDEYGRVLLHGRVTTAELDINADVVSVQIASADAAPLRLRRLSELAESIPEGSDQVVPWRYGRVGGYAIQLDTAGRRWVWADHPVQGIDTVEADDVRIDGWQYTDWTDRTGRRVALIELTRPASQVWATGRGRFGTAGLLESPASVLADIARSLGDPTAADLLTGATALASLRIAGSVEADGTVRDALRAVCASIGAMWSPLAVPALLELPQAGTIRHRTGRVERITRAAAPTRALARYGSRKGGPAGEVTAVLQDAERAGLRQLVELDLPWIPDAAQALAVAERILRSTNTDAATLTGLPADVRIGDVCDIDGERWHVRELSDIRGRDAAVTAVSVPRFGAPRITSQTTRAPTALTQQSLTAQPAGQSVRITDTSGQPLSGALVTVNGSGALRTDAGGVVQIPPAMLTRPAGQNVIRATRAGFAEVEAML